MFTPESWPKTESITPTSSARRRPGRNSSRSEPSSRASPSWISASSRRAVAAPLMRVSNARPRASCPALSSQRGLSGTNSSRTKNSTQGTISAPNMPRQNSATRVQCHTPWPPKAVRVGLGEPQDQPVRQVGQQDAQHDGQLVERDQPSAGAAAARTPRCRAAPTPKPCPRPPRRSSGRRSAR